MTIKVFDTLDDAREYARLHIWEIVFCRNNVLVVSIAPEDSVYTSFLYRDCFSEPGSVEFYDEVSDFFDYLRYTYNLLVPDEVVRKEFPDA